MSLSGPYRILAVDDDVLALNLIERVFADDPDVTTLTTSSPLRALEMAREQTIDLVIADQRMGDMTGLDLLQRLRELQPDAVRILLTAYPDLQAALKAINEGLVYRFMLKPWNVLEMRVSVRRAIEAHRTWQENQRLSLELRKQFDELVQAERLAVIGRLSAGVGHELSNAVTPLLARLYVLERRIPELILRAGLPEDDPVRQQVEQSVNAMQNAGRQVMGIAGGLKSAARPAAPAPWNANQGVEVAIQLLAHRLVYPVRLERHLGAIPDLLCRGQEMVQVLLNLIGNAVDELEQVGGGTVAVSTRATPELVIIEIADTGRGLPQRVQENLFVPFVSTKPPGRGTGLGLNICKSIVEAHGGRISVECAPGRGTVFTVALRRDAPEPARLDSGAFGAESSAREDAGAMATARTAAGAPLPAG